LFWVIGLAASLVLALSVTMPMMQEILRFSTPPIPAFAVAITTGLVAGSWFGLAIHLWKPREAGRL
jgi:hypothetical protein